MKIYEIIANELVKKPEERSFHFKQIEKYLKRQGFDIVLIHIDPLKVYYVLRESHPLGESILEVIANKARHALINPLTAFNTARRLKEYLMEDRETLFSDKVTYHNILVSFYKHNYIEYLDLKDSIFDKMQKIFHNNMPFLYNNSACHEIKFQFNGWGATIGKAGGTSCAKEYADEWNKFMNTKWGEEEVQEMTKDDLKTGMIVENRRGTRYMVLCGDLTTSSYGKQDILFIGEDGFDHLGVFNDNLTNIKHKELDIVKVYAPPMQGFGNTLKDCRNLLWSRTDAALVASFMAEIAELKEKLKEVEEKLEKELGK